VGSSAAPQRGALTQRWGWEHRHADSLTSLRLQRRRVVASSVMSQHTSARMATRSPPGSEAWVCAGPGCPPGCLGCLAARLPCLCLAACLPGLAAAGSV